VALDRRVHPKTEVKHSDLPSEQWCSLYRYVDRVLARPEAPGGYLIFAPRLPASDWSNKSVAAMPLGPEMTHRTAMSDQPKGLRMARYVNIGVWFWLLASDVLSPVRTGGDFWDAFSVNRYIFEPTYMIGVTVVILALWSAIDLLLRWL
jgi:hypothetical protein